MDLRRRVLPMLCLGICAASLAACSSDSAADAPAGNLTDSAVQVIANGCSTVEVHGAGMMVAPGKVATVAHVVAGAKSVEIRGTHGSGTARIVYFDPVLDLAVLDVDAALATPIPIGSATPGDRGSVVVYRDGAPRELEAGVQRLVQIRTADIYGTGTHLRPGYELNLDIQAGDSGAVVVVGGKATALVWATSRETAHRAWAMRASLLADHLTATTEVDHGSCA